MRQLRYRWYYPKCFRFRLPGGYALYLWAFSPLWPSSWRGRPVWQHRPRGTFNLILTLGPLEFTLNCPARSRLVRRAITREG